MYAQRQQLIKFIFQIAGRYNAFESVESALKGLTKAETEAMLIECGVLPEVFGHDSSEEKLWGKYSDILLATAFNYLGINAEVIRTRGDSADVFGKTASYSIVGDAKTFRLSRTAKNQKDFKIKALDDWRRVNDYAVLVGPLNQFPATSSQIYQQAIERNVTLLSYVHLRFMLESFDGSQDLREIWHIGKRLSATLTGSERKRALSYWQEVDRVVCMTFGDNGAGLLNVKAVEHEATRRLGAEGIQYWEDKIDEYKRLSRSEAVKRLIRCEKIEQKIDQIRRATEKDSSL